MAVGRNGAVQGWSCARNATDAMMIRGTNIRFYQPPPPPPPPPPPEKPPPPDPPLLLGGVLDERMLLVNELFTCEENDPKLVIEPLYHTGW